MEQRNFRTSGLWIARLRGIDLWIHWSLLLLFAYEIYKHWIHMAGWESLGYWGLWTAAIFATIFLHELGHCYAAFRVGGGADAIVLWPLGGLAYCDAPRAPRAQFWVAAGGPLVNVGLAAFLAAAFLAMDSSGLAPGIGIPFFSINFSAPYWLIFLQGFFSWNITILLFNLLPIYPLDGGRIFQAVLWARLRSYGRASLVTVWASRVALLLLVLFAFFFAGESTRWLTLAIAVWAFMHTEMLRHRLQEEEEDHVFGYDFSRGYTSLERTMVKEKRRSRRQKLSFFERYKRHLAKKRALKLAALKDRVDRLLEKISREGMQSLTPGEHRFLEGASRKLKER
ncbi:MAG: site-2 protease family protein [Planctomycetes bacterium]|nr:site-2 protease family protein [Planctomycetota bacterium]